MMLHMERRPHGGTPSFVSVHVSPYLYAYVHDQPHYEPCRNGKVAIKESVKITFVAADSHVSLNGLRMQLVGSICDLPVVSIDVFYHGLVLRRNFGEDNPRCSYR